MSRLYRLTSIGNKVLYDIKKKRELSLKNLAESDSDGDGILGRKLDLYGGMFLVWALAALLLQQLTTISAIVYLSILAPIVYYRVYQKKHRWKQQLINQMRKEKENEINCMENLMNASEHTVAKAIKDIISEKTNYTKVIEVGENLPLIASNEKEKSLFYLDRREKDSSVDEKKLQELVELAKRQDANKAAYFTTSSFSERAYEYSKALSDIKLILIDNKKLIKLLKEVNSPLYQKAESDMVSLEAKSKKLKGSDFAKNITGERKLAVKYLLVSAVLSVMAIFMDSWLKGLYYSLAGFNLFLGAVTYLRNLPEPVEENFKEDDLLL